MLRRSAAAIAATDEAPLDPIERALVRALVGVIVAEISAAHPSTVEAAVDKLIGRTGVGHRDH